MADRPITPADPNGAHWRVEMADQGEWTPVAVPCRTREDAEYLLALRNGYGLTYRITRQPAQEDHK